jgi:hypothetical protein
MTPTTTKPRVPRVGVQLRDPESGEQVYRTLYGVTIPDVMRLLGIAPTKPAKDKRKTK